MIPTNPEDERIVDALVARSMAPGRSRLGANPSKSGSSAPGKNGCLVKAGRGNVPGEVPHPQTEGTRVTDCKRQERGARTEYMWARTGSLNDGYDFDVVIVGARYCGTYEGGEWMALLADPEWLDDHQAGDLECDDFWTDYSNAPIGRGDTPNEALEDLKRIAREGREKFIPFRAERPE